MYQSLDNPTQPLNNNDTTTDPYDEPDQLYIDDSSSSQQQQQSDTSRLLPMTAKRPHPTSSIVQPSKEDNILCCSKVLHRHILHNDITVANTAASPCSPCASAETDPFHLSLIHI